MSPKSDRAVRRASFAASAGLVLMLAATVVYIGWPRVTSALGMKPAPPPPVPAAYAAGQQVDVPAAWYADAPHTLIVFARASCAACEKAQPFLKMLVSRMDGKGGAVMAHPPGALAQDQTYGRSLGVAQERVLTTVPGLRVKATPTIILVDRHGTIVSAWEGARPDRQADILKTIDAALR